MVCSKWIEVMQSLYKSILVPVTLYDQIARLKWEECLKNNQIPPGMGLSSEALAFLTHCPSLSIPISILFLYQERKPGRLCASWGGGYNLTSFSLLYRLYTVNI